VRAEEALRGQDFGEASFAQAGEAAAAEATVGNNWRAPEDYSRHLIRVMLPQVVQIAWQRAANHGKEMR
jgi:CO/xanthine dehydrogenase FAD-binding subunit